MKKLLPTILVGSLSAAGVLSAQDAKPATEPAVPAEPAAPAAPAQPEAPKLSDEEVKQYSSYWFGYRNGSDFARQVSQGGINKDTLDQDQFVKGILRGMSGEKPEIEEAKLQGALQQFAKIMQEKEKASAQANLEAGEKFLAENKKRDGVTTTKSGLQYEILKKGEGPVYDEKGDGAGARFSVHYKGTLPDGTVFDQSPEGQAVPMPLQVIPGFKEALTTMPTGSKWKLFIPSSLAYGAQRAGQQIGPNQALVFELELVEIIKQPQPAQGEKKPTATTKPIEVPAPEKK